MPTSNVPACDFLQDVVEQNQNMRVSGIAIDDDGSPECMLAQELRRILGSCPICMGDFRDHRYSLLATVAMNDKTNAVACLTRLLGCMRDGRWHDVLGFRQWIACADTIVTFAFRCDKGRMGIVSVFSPANSAVPDEPLYFTMLSLEEGKKVLAVIAPEHWIPLTAISGPYLLEA